MSKQGWLAHAAEVGYREMSKEARIVHANGCKQCKARARTRRANRYARERNDAYRSLGMSKTPYGWE